MNLQDCPVGARIRLEALSLDAATRLRLGELGIRRGTTVTVVQRAAFGGRVVACGHQRFAVDAVTASRMAGIPVGSP